MTTARNDLGVIFATSEAGKLSAKNKFSAVDMVDRLGRCYIGTSIMAGDEVSEDW